MSSLAALSPSDHSPFIAFGLWIIASSIGSAGLLWGLFRHESPLLYGLSLVLTAIIAAMGAAFF